MNQEDVLKRFQDQDDKIAFARLLDLYKMSEKTGKMYYSHFIDPYRVGVFLQGLYDFGCKATAFGGHPACERKIIAIGDSPWHEEASFPIGCLKIAKPKKAADLSHRDYLGAILALGIERTKIGDIFVQKQGVYSFVHEDIMGYIEMMLTKVAHVKVTVTQLPLADVTWEEDDMVSIFATVASLRLDAVLAAAFRLSRGKAQEFIQKEKAFVNFQVSKNSGQALKTGDMITVRGLGRAQLKEITGETKKGRIGIAIMKYN